MLEGLWKGMAQIGFCLDAIVEDYDRSGTGMLDDILGAIFGGDVAVEITAEDIPHDDAVVALQELDLAGFHLAVWRAKEA